jgi:hypothetical protein
LTICQSPGWDSTNRSPTLSTADVIVGLASDIRTRVSHQLIIEDCATPRYRWRWPWHRELVAVAEPDDLRRLQRFGRGRCRRMIEGGRPGHAVFAGGRPMWW